MENQNKSIGDAFREIKLSHIFRGNYKIWLSIFLLAVISILAAFSASERPAVIANDKQMWFFISHCFAIIISFLLIIIVQFIPIEKIRRWSKAFWLFALIIVVVTMIFGQEENQATRVLFGMRTFDFMKLAFPIYFARILVQKIDLINTSFKQFCRYVIFPTILSTFIFIKDNISTSIILLFVFSVILFISEVKIKYKLSIIPLFLGLIGILFLVQFTLGDKYPELKKIGRLETAKSRIESFVKGGNEKNQTQTIRAEAAIQSAGFFGVGPGQSYNKNIPQIESDFIFCLIVEEYGLIIAFFILFCYLWLLLYSLQIIRKLDNKFSIYAIVGITVTIVFQAFIHIFVNIGGPNTGQTLPFISQGRVSIFITAIAFGIIINLSSKVKNKAVKINQDVANQDVVNKNTEL